MKIAIITAGVLPVPAVNGGAVENLIDLCLEYNDKYHLHDITVYSIKDCKTKKHPALQSKTNHYLYFDVNSFYAKVRKTIYLYTRKSKNDYYHYSVEFFFKQVLKHIRKHPYDIILIENRPGFVLKLKDITNAPIVIHQENDYLNNQVNRYQEIYDATTCIINTSEYITKRVLTITREDHKSKTVLNGIDTKRFYEAKPLTRLQVGMKDQDFVIVYSGRLTKEKGISELILAISKLKVIPNIKLLILGASFYGSNQRPTQFIKNLEEATLPIRDKVFFTGFLSYNDIPAYLKMADIAVVPSMWEEPFGLTVVEAMAAGLPLITTRSGGIPEICEGVAIIVEKSDIINNLANAIIDLYQHPEKRSAMAEASLKRSKLFDKEIYAKNYFEAINSINKL